MRWLLWVTVLCVSGLGCPSIGTAKEEASGPAASFERALERIHTQRKKERFKPALESLRKLLRKHKEKPYVRAYRFELQDLAERLTFGLNFPAPEPGAAVEGKIERYDPNTGYIKISYSDDQRSDFGRESGFLVFPAFIRGPFSITVSGRKYPSSPPEIVFAGVAHPKSKLPQRWNIVYGTSRYLTSIAYYLDGKRSSRSKGVPSDCKSGERYSLFAKMGKTSVSAGANGRPLSTLRRSGPVEGQVGFRVSGWERMTFIGTIEPAWIQSRLDKIVQRDLKRFRKDYKPESVLPAWLLKPTEDYTYTPPTELPAQLDREHMPTFAKHESQLSNFEVEEAKKTLEALEKDGAPASVVAWLRANMLHATGADAEGLAAIDKCMDAAPDFLVGAIFRARLLSRMGREDEAIAAFQASIAKHPEQPLGYEVAAETCMFMGRAKDARTFTAQAAGQGVMSERLDKLGEVLTRALHGPTWARSHEYKSANYHVVSDISKNACKEAAKLLEEALTACRVQLHWTKKEKNRRFRVYLFNGQEGFSTYVQKIDLGARRPPTWAAGLYDHSLKHLLIWNQASKDAMQETIRHEGFHQYLDRLMWPPRWFNEGLAVYHENAERKRGRLRFGKPHASYAKLLAEKGTVPLKEFVFWNDSQFFKDVRLSYAQSWAFIHMLKKGDQQQRAIFKALMEDLQEGHAPDVMRKHLTPEVLDKLDADFKKYVKKLGKKK